MTTQTVDDRITEIGLLISMHAGSEDFEAHARGCEPCSAERDELAILLERQLQGETWLDWPDPETVLDTSEAPFA